MIDPRLVLLAAGSLLFGAIIVVEVTTGTENGAIVAAPAVARHGAERSKPWSPPPPIDPLVATILARPLFSPDRRPAEAPKSAAADLKDKRFTGIVIEPDRRLAIFAVTGAKPVVASEGDIVDGWRIESITADEIALVSAQGSRTLRPVPAPASEGRTPIRKAAPRPGADTKPNPAAEASQPDPKTATAARAKPPARTVGDSGVPSPAAGPRSTQPPPENQRGGQPLSVTGTAGQRR